MSDNMSGPEEASDYLSRTNFKTIIEFLSAEAILHRPEDPVTFIRDILDQKIDERAGGRYDPGQSTDYLKKCYADAIAEADENGRIQGKIFRKKEAETNDETDHLIRKQKTMEALFECSRDMAQQLTPALAVNSIVTNTIKMLGSDRATLFAYDEFYNELVLYAAEGATDIRVPLGNGIAGTVAANLEVVNIKDCYADPTFDKSYDEKTGYRTNTILCSPIVDASGKLVGVLQVINKLDGVFTLEDEEILDVICLQAGVALRNAEFFEAVKNKTSQFRSLLDVIKAMQNNLGVNSLLFTMNNQIPRVIGADRCTVYIKDVENEELWSIQGELNIKIPVGVGISGTVGKDGKTINIPDAYKDDRFNQAVDKKTGYKTNHILCMAIKAKEEIVGVVQLINKENGFFTEQDEEILEAFLGIAGPIMKESALFQSMQGSGKKGSDEGIHSQKEGKSKYKSSSTSRMDSMGGFAEEEEEEDSEEES